jgi:hypothetical protein
MKIIGRDDGARTVVVSMTFDEWDDLQSASGIRYGCEQRTSKAGASANTKLCKESVDAFNELSSIRKDFSRSFTSWEKLMNKMDLLLNVNNKQN